MDSELFTCRAEAKMLSTQWRLEYNHRRPHSSLNYQTPAAFAASCRKRKRKKKECREYTACGGGGSPPEDTNAHPLLSSGGARISRQLS